MTDKPKAGSHEYRIWPVSSLIPYVNNSRTHSDEQVLQVAASINEFGFTNPVLIDEKGGIIAGHGRVMAAKKLNIDEIPCITLAGLTDAQKKAYVIADNQLALNAGWDLNSLKLEIETLKELDFDIDMLGFDDDFIDGLLEEEPNDGLTDEDACPEPPEAPVSVPGDIWVLGNHRLMCGDSTSIDAVDRLMDGQKADFCFTSPPYGQQRDYKKSIDDWDSMMNGVYSILPVKDGAQVLVNLGLIHSDKEWQPYWEQWIEYMRDCGWLRFGLYVWDQGAGMMGDHHGRLAPSFEMIFHFCKENKKARKTKDSKGAGNITGKGSQRGKDGKVKQRTGAGKPVQDTKVGDSIIRVNRQKTKNTGHPAAFPVELCRELSNPWAKRGDICYEPFTGSGTQIINCEKEGYIFHGMELAPEYVDIAVLRWQDFTGKQAILESGETFAEIANNRELPLITEDAS